VNDFVTVSCVILVVCAPNAESKNRYCLTCKESIGSAVQAAAHYRSREHINRRLQRGLPVAELPASEQDPSSTSRHFINDCLRRGVHLQPPDVSHSQPGIALKGNCSLEEHQRSREHINRLLQLGIEVPISCISSTSENSLPAGDIILLLLCIFSIIVYDVIFRTCFEFCDIVPDVLLYCCCVNYFCIHVI